jgi:ribose transport system ATP-binding protein
MIGDAVGSEGVAPSAPSRAASSRAASSRAASDRVRSDRVALAVDELRLAPASASLSFDARGGEILGLFGLVGAGRTELVETLFGLRRPASGIIELGPGASATEERRPFAPCHPADAIAAGLVLVPEDRKTQGLIAEMSVAENLSLASNATRSPLAWRRRAEERRRAEGLCAMLDIRPPRPAIEVSRLSGGNQQKVVLGKWLALAPRVLLLDEPTRGVDVGARSEIYALIDQLAGEGVAILMISSDMEEVLGMSDRVLVLHEGRLAGGLSRADLSEEAVMHLATGGGVTA